MNHLIIGAGFAGASAAKAIRDRDPAAVITMISGEKTNPYHRPLIPLLIGNRGMDLSFDPDPAAQYGISMIHEPASGIIADSREVLLFSGRKISFDRLLIASGSSPLLPDLPGVRGKGVFTLRTIADALEIGSFTAEKGNVVVVGGGLVGLKAAISLNQIGLRVTIVELMGHILPRNLDRRSAGIISDAVSASGIKIVTRDSAVEVIRRSGKVETVRLASGGSLDADMVLFAIGIRPNTRFLAGSGIKVNRGVLVDDTLRTSVPDIYAAGDAAEYVDSSTGAQSVNALWTSAGEMGKIAGRNMAGGNWNYRGVLPVMNSTEILDIPVMSMGEIEPEGENFEAITTERNGRYSKLVLRNDHLVGAVFIGDIPNPGIYGNLIRNRIPLGSLREKVKRGTISYPDFMARPAAQEVVA